MPVPESIAGKVTKAQFLAHAAEINLKLAAAEAATIYARSDGAGGLEVNDVAIALGDSLPVAPFTAIQVADRKTPAQLTMRVVHNERSRNPFPLDGPHAPFREEFQAAPLSGRYTITTASGTSAPASETVANGRLTLTAPGGGVSQRHYRSHTKLLMGCGVFMATLVQPGSTGTTTQALAGFRADTEAGPHIFAYYQPSNGTVGLFNGGGIGLTTGVAPTFAALVNPTQPVWVGLLLDYPRAIAVYSLDGVSWQIATTGTMSGSNLYDEAVWNALRPYGGLRAEANTSIATSRWVAGYVGSVGFRDQKPVTYKDGTPLRKDGKYWWTGTVAHGAENFRNNSMAVYSFDPDTYQVELVRHLYYDLVGTGIGAGYGGQMVYDEQAGLWHVLANSWGFDDQSSGVDLIYATTSKNLLTPGASLLQASRLTGLSTFSLYDCTLRHDGTNWLVVAVETDVRTGWTNLPNAVLFSGTSLTSLTRVRSDETVGVDGTCWTKIGGSWYVTAVDNTSTFQHWDATLQNRASLPSWRSDAKVSALMGTVGNFPPHAGTLAIDDERRTRYCVLTYDYTTVTGAGVTRGGLAVLEADEKPTGQEHAPKANDYFGY